MAESLKVLCSVNTLLSSSLLKVMEFLPNYLPSLEVMPSNIKDRVILLMSKRGLLTNENLSLVLHDRVRVLDLTDSEITDAGLSVIAQFCPQLRKVDLNSITQGGRTQITSQGVSEIAKSCPLLQVVYLRRCSDLTDEGVIALSTHCRQLRELNLGGCSHLSDACLQSLGNNSSMLKSLNVSKTNITDAGILSLVSGQCSQSLKELLIAGCQHVTDETVEAVLEFCSNIQIFIFHSCPHITGITSCFDHLQPDGPDIDFNTDDSDN